MSDLVRYKRPAQVVRARPLPVLPQRVETVVGSKRAVLAEVARLKKTRELVDTGAFRLIEYGPQMGLFELRVVLRQAPERPRWTRIALAIGSVLMGLSGVLLSLVWLLASMTPAALAMFLVAILVAFLGWLRLKYGGGRTRGVTVTTVTRVEVR